MQRRAPGQHLVGAVLCNSNTSFSNVVAACGRPFACSLVGDGGGVMHRSSGIVSATLLMAGCRIGFDSVASRDLPDASGDLADPSTELMVPDASPPLEVPVPELLTWLTMDDSIMDQIASDTSGRGNHA